MVKNQILDNINKSNASIQFEDRGHSITIWTRREGWGSVESLGHRVDCMLNVHLYPFEWGGGSKKSKMWST